MIVNSVSAPRIRASVLAGKSCERKCVFRTINEAIAYMWSGTKCSAVALALTVSCSESNSSTP